MSIPAQGAVGAETMTAGLSFDELQRAHAAGIRACNWRLLSQPVSMEILEKYLPAAVAVLASPRADSDQRTAEAILTEACKPWERYTGEPPDDGSPLSGVFVAGMVYTERLLAKLLDVTHYEGGDGSEDFDNDATQTLRNILTGARLWDADENRPVSATPAQPAGAVPDSLIRASFEATSGLWRAEPAVDEHGRQTGQWWLIMADQPMGYEFDRWEDARLAADAVNFVRTLIASHPAGQSAGTGAERILEPKTRDEWLTKAEKHHREGMNLGVLHEELPDLIAALTAPDSTRTGQGEERETIAREIFITWFLADTASHDGHEEEATLAWETGTDFPDAFTLAYAAADRIIAARPAAPEAQGASPTLPMSYHLMCEEERRLHTVMEVAATWHDDQAKALSKQPPGGARDWQRLEHEEQAQLLREDRIAPPASSGQGGR